MKVTAACLIGFFVLILSLTAVLQAQLPKPKPREIEPNDKYGKDGTLETTFDEKTLLRIQKSATVTNGRITIIAFKTPEKKKASGL